MEIEVATLQQPPTDGVMALNLAMKSWAPTKPQFTMKADFSRLDGYEIRVYQELGGAELRAAVELVRPGNKDRPGSRLLP